MSVGFPCPVSVASKAPTAVALPPVPAFATAQAIFAQVSTLPSATVSLAGTYASCPFAKSFPAIKSLPASPTHLLPLISIFADLPVT